MKNINDKTIISEKIIDELITELNIPNKYTRFRNIKNIDMVILEIGKNQYKSIIMTKNQMKDLIKITEKHDLHFCLIQSPQYLTDNIYILITNKKFDELEKELDKKKKQDKNGKNNNKSIGN